MIGPIMQAWRAAGRTGDPRLLGLAHFGIKRAPPL
jgi:hypothetical protein